MRKITFSILLLGAFLVWFHFRKPVKPLMDEPESVGVQTVATPAPAPSPAALSAATRPPTPAETKPATVLPAQAPAPRVAASKIKKQNDRALPFVMDDGVAVTQGDLVLGQLVNDDGTETGYAKAPDLKLWPTNEIPFMVDPNLPRPERVDQAMALFQGTTLRFVPARSQKDIIVFREASGICKSYVGRIGGAQSIWVSANCEPKEIAHEIMHALGFVHEQNRVDRDRYVKVIAENIEEKYADNFEKLPEDWMRITGRAAFDYESIMMYPPWMFAKSGKSTMESNFPDRPILPGEVLSGRDVERINTVYFENAR